MIWIKNLSVLRPHNAKIISWEVVIFQITRWPWILFGTIAACTDTILRRNFEIQVTPKGKVDVDTYPIHMIIPYTLLSILAASVAIFQSNPGSAQGYYYFLIIASVFYAISFFTIILRDIYERKLNMSMIES